MRLGAGVPKALVPLAGRVLLDWTLDAVLAADVDTIVVAAPPAALDRVRALVAVRTSATIRVVAGGASRQQSVALALAEVPDDEVVLVHDAARPLTPSAVFDAVRAAVMVSGAGVVPALTPADTV
ncbi:MAG: putative 2-C-methyl-D-erythritol 4-phosphate cytidylyltransferase, partial [Amnibacterium sp.]|nr:putative 2-C-methyl-D-erythritol 4-phosphate cytidylyltransferase [Amnibacterium sp.]